MRKRERKGRERKGEGKEREAGSSLPSPFPIRHATGSGEPFAASGSLGDPTWLGDFLTSK